MQGLSVPISYRFQTDPVSSKRSLSHSSENGTFVRSPEPCAPKSRRLQRLPGHFRILSKLAALYVILGGTTLGFELNVNKLTLIP